MKVSARLENLSPHIVHQILLMTNFFMSFYDDRFCGCSRLAGRRRNFEHENSIFVSSVEKREREFSPQNICLQCVVLRVGKHSNRERESERKLPRRETGALIIRNINHRHYSMIGMKLPLIFLLHSLLHQETFPTSLSVAPFPPPAFPFSLFAATQNIDRSFCACECFILHVRPQLFIFSLAHYLSLCSAEHPSVALFFLCKKSCAKRDNGNKHIFADKKRRRNWRRNFR